jgi:hypothetical protein
MTITSQHELSMSCFTEEALTHLKRVKPLDGWSVDIYWSSTSGEQKTMLCRRNIPLADDGFTDIYYDRNSSGCVVGLLDPIPKMKSITSSTIVSGLVLVEADGSVARRGRNISVQLIRATTTKINSDESTRAEPRRPNATSTPSVSATPTPLSDEENKQLLKMACYILLLSVLLKVVLSSALAAFYLIVLPVIIFYAIQTIPSNQSFDAKRELKRVLRGENLPADHPDKPKTWLEQTLSRVGATVTAEVAMGLGYEVSLTNVVGVAKVAYVRLPVAKMNCYWLGVFGRWYYVTTVRDREEDNQQAR